MRKASRTETLHIRLTEREKRRAEEIAEKLGGSVSAAFRQGINRLYDELFRERETPRRER